MARSTHSRLRNVSLKRNARRKQNEAWMDDINVRQAVQVEHRSPGGSIQVQGVDGVMTNLARCCNPVPGDSIVGYVTRDRGITVHRTSCPNIVDKIRRGRDKQLIEVQWKTKHAETFPVKIQVSAYDRSGLDARHRQPGRR